MGELKLGGQTGYGKELEVTNRKIKDGVSLDKVKQATANNNLDEVVVKDSKGNSYVSYADELSVKDGKLPKVGDKVNLPFIDGEAVVTHVDDEWNEDLGFGAYGILGVGAIVASRIADKGGIQGDHTDIDTISESLGKPAAKELSWALELENKVNTQNYQPSTDEKNKYEDIYFRLSKSSDADKQDKAADKTSENIQNPVWAFELLEKAKTGYEPTTQEVERFENTRKDWNGIEALPKKP